MASSRSADLKVEGLVKRFGEVVALDGVSLDIASGELLTILGPSGSGKTTLLKVVAGFETPEFPFELTLGLLNSTLYRALHLAARRDARQGAFPQVKIAHLRALPALPRSARSETIVNVAREASAGGLNVALRQALDAAVFGHFGISAAEAQQIAHFVRERSPQAGLTVPLGP